MGLLLPLVLRCKDCPREIRVLMQLKGGLYFQTDPSLEADGQGEPVGWLLPSSTTPADNITCPDCLAATMKLVEAHNKAVREDDAAFLEAERRREGGK